MIFTKGFALPYQIYYLLFVSILISEDVCGYEIINKYV